MAVQLLFCEITISFILLAGLFILQKMQMTVEKYYASEVDKDAINVSKCNYGNKIEYVGAVETLTQQKLHSLGRIDLLLGGSPCTELSLANPARKGIYGRYVHVCNFFGKHTRE
jgi:site-specific DNA-cytosine methylase